MPKFSDILTKGSETIERPPLPPKGTYEWIVTGIPKTREAGAFETVDIPVQAVAASEDVDANELAAWGDLKKNKIVSRVSFLFNTEDENEFANTEFRFTEFLTQHLSQDDASIKELMSSAPNKRFLGELDYRPDKNDPERLYVNIRKTAPVA